MSSAFGQVVKEPDIIKNFLTGPGEFIVAQTLLQMSSVPPFLKLFGPYTPKVDADGNKVGAKDSQRWSDYSKYDWTMRQLPAISIYEGEVENKVSKNAWLNGSIMFQIFWPASQRRSDWSRVQTAFKGAMQNFFESHWITDMLDELFKIQRPMKVPGLNEYGKELVWTPNVEGIIENEAVPVTLITARYRIDLRAWYRAMEFDDRTVESPFERTLADLTEVKGEYDGVTQPDGSDVQIALPIDTPIQNP